MKYFDLITQKLNNELSARQLADFEEQLKINPELAEEYELQKFEESILDIAVEEDVWKEIKKHPVGQEQPEKERLIPTAKVVKIRQFKRILSIAAGFAFLITAFFVVKNMTTSTPQEIAQSFYQKYPPNFSGTKSIGEEAESFQQNKSLLQSNQLANIQTAIDYFEIEKENTVDAWYYLAHGYLKKGDYLNASMSFDDFLAKAKTDSRLIPQAEYYRILSLIAQDRAIKDEVNAIKNGHLFEKQFEELLEEIN